VSNFKSRLKRHHHRLSVLGFGGLSAVALAAYVLAVILMVGLFPAGRGLEDVRPPELSRQPPEFPASDYLQSQFPPIRRDPLIGVNYTHYAFRRCSYTGTGILANYQEPGVAQRVHSQLFQMRKAGIATIKTVIWHATDTTGQNWGPIPSAGGKLREPYRSNLIHFLTEIRRFGFVRLTAKFAPTGANDPRLPTYEKSKLKENWHFIEYVRPLIKRYGPADTRLDIVTEGAPSETRSPYFPRPAQSKRYARTLYGLYVKRFGNRDVDISTIGPTDPNDRTNRLQTLISALRSSGEPLPRRWDVHIAYTQARASHALSEIDSTLTRNGLRQPLIVGETAYDSRGVAAAIKSFLQSSSRGIEEVAPWYLRRIKGCQVQPPYRPGSYAEIQNPAS
jgi:hypothetical protein